MPTICFSASDSYASKLLMLNICQTIERMCKERAVDELKCEVMNIERVREYLHVFEQAEKQGGDITKEELDELARRHKRLSDE